jgi:hypothetical protein
MEHFLGEVRPILGKQLDMSLELWCGSIWGYQDSNFIWSQVA